jgi:hypothetical protein
LKNKISLILLGLFSANTFASNLVAIIYDDSIEYINSENSGSTDGDLVSGGSSGSDGGSSGSDGGSSGSDGGSSGSDGGSSGSDGGSSGSDGGSSGSTDYDTFFTCYYKETSYLGEVQPNPEYYNPNEDSYVNYASYRGFKFFYTSAYLGNDFAPDFSGQTTHFQWMYADNNGWGFGDLPENFPSNETPDGRYEFKLGDFVETVGDEDHYKICVKKLPLYDNTDYDNDGIYDHLDLDADNDGFSNSLEKYEGSNHLDENDYPLNIDNDNDGIYDYMDLDDDNDTYPDIIEKFDFMTDPFDSSSFEACNLKPRKTDDPDAEPYSCYSFWSDFYPDVDDDGFNDMVEFLQETNHLDSNDKPNCELDFESENSCYFYNK